MEDLYPSRQREQPIILPRQDPVVHGRWGTSAPISQEQSKHFDSFGFLVLPEFFDQATTRRLQTESERLRAGSANLRPETIITERGSTKIRSIFEIHTQSEVMDQLTSDERLTDIAHFLLADEVYVHQSRLNYKPGFHGREFYWHSDFETWHVEDGMPRMRALSVSVLLAPNTEHNGPLLLMPGSHLHYAACIGATPEDHYLQSLKKQEYGVPDAESLRRLAEPHGIVAATGGPGTAIIFDCNIMHGSNSNITPAARSNAFIVFNSVRNRLLNPFGGMKPRPEFIAARQVRPVRTASAPRPSLSGAV